MATYQKQIEKLQDAQWGQRVYIFLPLCILHKNKGLTMLPFVTFGSFKI